MLVYGLGDLFYFFCDVVNVMCSEGIYVRIILLLGYGLKFGDMLNVSY